MLVAVDDAQWADEQSLRFLAHLALRIDELPIALLVAVRTGAPDAPERSSTRCVIPSGAAARAPARSLAAGWRRSSRRALGEDVRT